MTVRNPYRPWWLYQWLHLSFEDFVRGMFCRLGSGYLPEPQRLLWAARHATKRLRAERDAARSELSMYEAEEEKSPIDPPLNCGTFMLMMEKAPEHADTCPCPRCEVPRLRAQVAELRAALGVLAEFARTAPGRLPGRITDALAVYDRTLPPPTHDAWGQPIEPAALAATEPKP